MKVWQTAPAPGPDADPWARDTGLPEAVIAVLIARGVQSAEAAERFLRPRLSDVSDPFDIPDMEAAARRILRAVESREKIVLFGDYDVDGITSAALLTSVLRRLGADAVPFLPHREDDGYGLHPATLDRCLDLHRPSLLVTVDCGTGSVDAVQRATERGVDVVITDHHELPDELAPALAVVNPKRGHPSAPWRDCCGVGVAFKLCHALVREKRRGGADADVLDLRNDLDLVALGTIADVAPLTGENRILARHGLERIGRTANPGLHALLQVAGVKGPIEPHHVGFMLAPRLNAAGRLGTAELALELLLTRDDTRAMEIAEELDEANAERRQIEKEAYRIAERQTEDRFDPERSFGIVAVGDDWHPGVIGIVASRLMDRFHRPAIVITTQRDGRVRGSCRGIEGFHLVEALSECSDLLLRHGGHAMAAGLELDPNRIEPFRQRFNEVAAARLKGQDLRPRLTVDQWVTLPDANDHLADALDLLQPFGAGHKEPVFAAGGVSLAAPPRRVGERHLRLLFQNDPEPLEAIAFRMADREIPPEPFEIAFTLKWNEWRGRKRIQLNIRDFRPATSR